MKKILLIFAFILVCSASAASSTIEVTTAGGGWTGTATSDLNMNGNDILDSTGNLHLNDAVTIDGTATVAGGLLRAGSGGTPSFSTAAGDLYAQDDIEVVDDLYVGGLTYTQGGVIMDDDVGIIGWYPTWGSTGSRISLIRYDKNNQTNPALMVGVPNTDNYILVIENLDSGFDFSHSSQTNPTIFLHSANQSTTEWISLAHDQTNGVIATGAGDLQLAPNGGDVLIPSREICQTFTPASLSLGVTAPTATTVGTFRGLLFDADAETVFLDIEVNNGWDAASDMNLRLYWTNEAADAIADTETVKFDITFRSIDFENSQDIENGTVATGTTTYTQTGAGGDGDTHVTDIVIDYDNANQPLALDDTIGISFNRDVTTDTYSGGTNIFRFEICYSSVEIPNHL